MVVKKCVVCGEEFDARNNAICCSKECSRERRKEKQKKYNKKWYAENRDDLLAKNKKYRDENPEYFKEYYAKNRDDLLAKNKKYRDENRDDIIAKKKKYYGENRDDILAKKKKHYAENRDDILAKRKEYYGENRDDISAKKRERAAERLNRLILEAEKTGIDNEIIELCKKDMINGSRALECYIDGLGNYYKFLDSVHSKYNDKCAVTGSTKNLRVHHINSYNTNPDLACDVENGILLCEDVHNQFHNKYGRGDNTVEQWNEFVKEFNKNRTTLDNFK